MNLILKNSMALSSRRHKLNALFDFKNSLMHNPIYAGHRKIDPATMDLPLGFSQRHIHQIVNLTTVCQMVYLSFLFKVFCEKLLHSKCIFSVAWIAPWYISSSLPFVTPTKQLLKVFVENIRYISWVYVGNTLSSFKLIAWTF